MKSIISVSSSGLQITIDHLRMSGACNREGIVLWLARQHDGRQRIELVYEPMHEAAEDFFWIPQQGMQQLMRVLDEQGLRVAAQVHSHPEHAFHSVADDRWAIVRHQGALSIVLPWFASKTTADTFLCDAAVFQLDNRNIWREVSKANYNDVIEVK